MLFLISFLDFLLNAAFFEEFFLQLLQCQILNITFEDNILHILHLESTSFLTNAHSNPVASPSVSKVVTILIVSAVATLSTTIIIIFKRKQLNSAKVAVIPQSERESPEGCSLDSLSAGKSSFVFSSFCAS